MTHDHPPTDANGSPTSFDERAATWDDDPAKVARAHQLATAIRSAVEVDPLSALLEVGAGTGLVASDLANLVSSVTVSDPSAGMRSVMQRKAQTPGHPLFGASVIDLDLDGATPAPADIGTFGLLVAAMVLHHVADLDVALATLTRLAAPAGAIALADLDPEDGSFHGEGFDGHLGIDRHELARRLTAAGWINVAMTDAGTVDKQGRLYGLFLVTAQRRDDSP